MLLSFQLDGFREPACFINRCDADSIVGVVADVDAATVVRVALLLDVIALGRSQEEVCVASFQ
jgi:hypothetical protein